MTSLDLDTFMTIVQENHILQIVCLSGQGIATIVSFSFIKSNLDGYPIKQNTNILTILLLVSFFSCNLIIFCVNYFVIGNSQFLNPNKVCFWDNQTVQIWAYVYTFLSQMTIPAICLKMFRVSVAYYQPLMNRKWIVKWMSNRIYILGTVLGWSLIWTLIQLITNEVIDRQKDFKTYGGLQLYQFFCQKLPSNDPSLVWLFQLIKFIITSTLYLVQYGFAYKINPDYRFKSQYNSQALILLTAMYSRCILDLYNINNMVPWYYYTIFMYYISTVTITYYHRKSSTKGSYSYPNQIDFEKPLQTLRTYEGFKNWFYKFQKSIGRKDYVKFSEKLIPLYDSLKLKMSILLNQKSQNFQKQEQLVDDTKNFLIQIFQQNHTTFFCCQKAQKQLFSQSVQKDRQSLLKELQKLRENFLNVRQQDNLQVISNGSSEDLQSIMMNPNIRESNKKKIQDTIRVYQQSLDQLMAIFNKKLPSLIDKIYSQEIQNWKKYQNYQFYKKQRIQQEKLIENLHYLNIALGPNDIQHTEI